jgi:peptidyl-prolyl cis-trans isomerase A (cyclophilin A)
VKTYSALACISLPLLLAACGGGSGGGVPLSQPGAITSVTPDKLTYGKTVKFTIVGTGLERGVTVSAGPCRNSGLQPGGTATQQVLTCTPSASGAVQISFLPTGNTTPFVSNQTIPVPQVTMKTNAGDLVFELYPNNAPVSVDNFLQYVTDNFYTGLIFHRVVSNFVVQGGGFNASLQPATTRAAIKLESGNGLSNTRGSLAMARTDLPNTATSQFYINTVDNSRALDATTAGVNGYAVFGKVVTGLALIDQINTVPTGTVNGLTNVPVTPIIITSATQTQ